MFKRLFTTPRALQTRLWLAVALMGCLVWLALTIFRGLQPDAVGPVRTASAEKASIEQRPTASRQLNGEQARVYLEQTSDGQSLMQAATVARFGLKRE